MLESSRIYRSLELTKSLKLVYKLVENIECPVWKEEEGGLSGFNVIFVQYFIQKLSVDVPAFDAIANVGTTNGVPVTMGDFSVNG